ncbi:MAG TPA: 23S rRNA (adenine(1618)-N(6))-methyltransferase RlmF [Spirochaeta sp.]|nr:23S rRNA (adenine(1618)-N(6))-methyltransferase RlmF [Spirochaeta sp.]
MKNKQKKSKSQIGKLHPRNPHSGRYDFASLCKSCPELTAFVKPNRKGDDTIDFTDANAVITLNKAILSRYYDIKVWNIPDGYLCPPIPGRADYIHYLADLLSGRSKGIFPTGKRIKVLDIGTGASCIYPIIGSRTYGWKFIGTEIDPVSLKSARTIVESNSGLNKLVRIIRQKENSMFKGIIREQDRFDLSLCNPPFHTSQAEAEAGNQRKWKNLGKDTPESKRNFGGRDSELWFPGGEIAFIKQMINESAKFRAQVCWFTSLVSKGEHVLPLKNILTKSGAVQIRIVKMEQGQKTGRFIAWSFLTAEQQETFNS